MIRKRYARLPLPLRRQLLRHGLLGCAIFILALAVAAVEKDVALLALGLILTALFLGYAVYLLCAEYVAVKGVCTALERSWLFGKTVTVEMQADGRTLRIPMRGRQRRIEAGNKLILYLNRNARVYEDNGVLIVCDYRLLLPDQSTGSSD